MQFKGKYEQLAESTIVRYQNGGILIGDLVKVRPNALKHPKLKEMGEHVKQIIQKFIDTELNIRVCATRSAYPDANAAGMGLSVTNVAPSELWVDVCLEMAPGLVSDPLTLPASVIDVVNTGINCAPIPDELKRKGKINIKPENAEYTDNNTIPKDQHDTRTLATKNTVLPFTKSAKQPTLKDNVNIKLNDEDQLLEAYRKVCCKDKILTVCVPNVFADNVETLLATENMKHFKTVNGQKTYFDVVFNESKSELEKFIRKNAMGDMTFLVVSDSDQQIDETKI